jgi:predicted permease
VSKWLRYFEVIRRNPRRDIDDEIASHLELREADLRARGLSASEAKARAASEFGDASAARLATLAVDERMMRREQRSEMLHNFVRDARVALRSMRANPGFAISATLCAGLGIGITAAIVAASYAILVKSLPFPDSDRLVTVYTQHARLGYNEAPLSYPDFVDWRDNNRSFTGIAIWNWNTKTLSSDARAEAERVSGADVSWNLFRVLGVRPAIGRDFLAEEDAPGRNYEVILSHRLWQRRFAGDSGIVGKTIPLDGRPWTVIGVMPAGFNFPDVGDLWSPFAAGPNEGRGNRGYAAAIARLKPGVTVAQATADLHRIDAPLEILYPEDKRGWLAEVMPIREDLIGNLRDPVRVLLASVALVLLLACANITNLALARGVARGREIAIRGAIGASRARIVRQLMT